MKNRKLYNITKNFFLSDKRCFLCGKQLRGNKSSEHIFPKRLIEEFNIKDKTLHLLNNTEIPYRQLKISCCKNCNNNYLSKIEIYIKSFYDGGFNKFKDIDKDKLFIRLSKIFYGIICKESFLLYDRSKKYKGTITSKKLIKRNFQMLHFFLQGARINIKFEVLKPYSIFIFHLQKSINNELNFDFKDSIQNLTIGIRIGEIGIIAVLQDNSKQYEISKDIEIGLENKKLHPIQFLEFYTSCTYGRKLMRYTPEYLSSYTKDQIQILCLPIGKPTIKLLSNKSLTIFSEPGNKYPIFSNWNQEDFSSMLSFYLGVEKNNIFVPPDRVMSRLRKDDNSFNEITNDQNFT